MNPLSPLQTLLLTFTSDCEATRHDLSAVCCVDQQLWLGCDETTGLERLNLTATEANHHQHVAVNTVIDLPAANRHEIDLEGIDYDEHYVWIVGSHSLKRTAPKPKHTDAENIERLATLKREANRYLLARIPLVNGDLYRTCPHPHDPSQTLTSACLPFKASGNALTQALKSDPHLGCFLKAGIPGKDNGFDIEGLAVQGDRLFLGLRGPVLRGWAVLLELNIKVKHHHTLKLRQLTASGQRYRKHFLDLQGLGIRDICRWRDGLLILAGPTMALPAPVQLFYIPHLAALTQEALIRPDWLGSLPAGSSVGNAEGLTVMPNGRLLVVYDSPAPSRLEEPSGVRADLFALPDTL